MTFNPNVAANAGDHDAVQAEFKAVVQQLEVDAREDATGTVWVDFQTGSYDPIRVSLAFPEEDAILVAEGELLALDQKPGPALRLALNFLNVEVDAFRFFTGEGHDGPAVLIRHDLLPNLNPGPAFLAREVKSVLTGMCAHKAVFAESLAQALHDDTWQGVQDALRSFR